MRVRVFPFFFVFFLFLYIFCFVFQLVPPVIEPFNFPGDGLVEGTRTRVVCGVSHGDPPLSIAWLKDGAPVLLRDDGEDPSSSAAVVAGTDNGGAAAAVVVTTLDPYSSLLSIARLTRHHTGRYTCQAENPAARARYTAALLVKGKCVCGCAAPPPTSSGGYPVAPRPFRNARKSLVIVPTAP